MKRTMNQFCLKINSSAKLLTSLLLMFLSLNAYCSVTYFENNYSNSPHAPTIPKMGNSSLLIEWNGKIGVVYTFELFALKDNGAIGKTILTQSINTPFINITECSKILVAGQEYGYKVTSLDKALPILFSDKFVYWPDCSPVSNLTASVEEGQVHASWEDKDKDDNTIYNLQYIIFTEGRTIAYTNEFKTTDLNLDIPIARSNIESIEITVTKNCRYANGIQQISKESKFYLTIAGKVTSGFRCDFLTGFLIDSVKETSIRVNLNTSAPPGLNNSEPWYKVSYKLSTADDWAHEYFYGGSNSYIINNLSEGQQYNVKVQMSYGGTKENPTTSCTPLATQTVKTRSWFNSSLFECKDTTISNTIPSAGPLSSLSAGEIIIINLFPIKVLNATGGNGSFSGVGIIPLPFGGKVVNVEFTNISVNELHYVTSGTVTGAQDQALNTAFNNKKSYSSAAEFKCEQYVEDESKIFGLDGLNKFGFDSTGHYAKHPPYPGWVEGMPFDSLVDPYGFDTNGINIITGGKYDESGCDQEGNDEFGKPCNHVGVIPYYWLYPKNPTQAGLNFVNKNKTAIRILALEAIDSLIAVNKIGLDSTRLSCNLLKTKLKDCSSELNLDPIYLFGQDSLYIKEGLSKIFVTPPAEFSNYSSRDEKVLGTEKTHFDLYNCDFKLNAYKDMEHILEVAKQDTTNLFALIETWIAAQDSSKIKEFEVENVLFDFIYSSLDEEMKRLYFIQYHEAYGYKENTKTEYNQQYENVWDKNQCNKTEKFKNSGVGCTIDQEAKLQLLKLSTIGKQYLLNEKYKEIENRGIAIETLIKQRTNTCLTQNNAISFPIEISKELASVSASIYFNNLVITTQSAIIDAYYILQASPSNKKLVFASEELEFTVHGLKNPGRLRLVGQQSISLGKSLNVVINGGADSTFIDFDCTGYNKIGLDANIEFCSDYIISVDPVTKEVQPETPVSAHFKVVMESWGNALIQLNVPEFALSKNTDYRFAINEAWFDFSETQSIPSITYPAGYTHPQQNTTQWQGVYFKNLSITLPDMFKKNDDQDLKININNFVYDNLGLSGNVNVTPLLSLQDGSIGKWAFSIDTFNIGFVHNNFVNCKLTGLVNVPLFKAQGSSTTNVEANDCFAYRTSADATGNLLFKVTFNSKMDVPMMYADATLLPGTSITIAKQNGVLEVQSNLYGNLFVNNKNMSGTNISIDTIQFQNLILSSKAPFIIDIGSWTFPAIQLKLGAFKMNLDNIILNGNDDKIQLDFNTKLDLGLSEKGINLGASASLFIKGKLVDVGNHSRWVYDDFGITGGSVSGGKTGLFQAHGEIKFYKDDNVYGKGFTAGLILKFDKLSIDVSAVATFGTITVNNEDQKYGMIDVLANAGKTGIPLFPPINANGFGGGFWYNMQQPNLSGINLLNSVDYAKDQITPGKTLSGTIYMPGGNGFGFKATLAFNVVNAQAINGNASLIVDFSEKTIKSMRIEGNVRVMGNQDINGSTEFGSGKPNSGAPISAYASIEYIFAPQEECFNATFQSYLRVGDVIKGSGLNDAFEQINLHIKSKDEWHFWVGEPGKNQSGITIQSLGTDIKTYFCVGKQLPPPAKLDADLAKFFNVNPDFANSSFVKNGGGFMHGLKLNIGFNKSVWILTLDAQLVVGYDIAMLNYGNTVCTNFDNEKVGMNGWYASGQAYIYARANVGYDIDLWLTSAKGTIAALEAGALFQTQFPNPFWAKGKLKVKFNLFSVVKGGFDFNVELGERCNMASIADDSTSTVQQSFKLINSVEPDNNIDGVPVNSNMKVNFNFDMQQPFIVPVINQDTVDNFTFKVNYSLSYYFSPDQLIPYNNLKSNYSSDGTELNLIPRQFLLPNTRHKLMVIAKVYKNKVFYDSDTARIYFTTGNTMLEIPESNIQESFPHVGQKFFFLKEMDSRNAYIQLLKSQSSMLTTRPIDHINTIKVIETATKKICHLQELKYECSKNQILFDSKWLDKLEPQHKYTIIIEQVPQTLYDKWKADFHSSGSRQFGGSSDQTAFPPFGPPSANICPQQIDYSSEGSSEELVFLTYDFSTSIFDNMKDKLDYIFVNKSNIASNQDSISGVYAMAMDKEPFDEYELIGVKNSAAFLNFSLDFNSMEWFKPYLDMYKDKPYSLGNSDYKYEATATSQGIENVAEDCMFFNYTENKNTEEIGDYTNMKLNVLLSNILKSDIKSIFIKFKYDVAKCIPTINDPINLNAEEDCLEKYDDPSLILSKKYKNIQPVTNGSLKLRIKYNSKPATNNGIGDYKYELFN